MYDGLVGSTSGCVLAIGAHPDDAALSVGGVLAQFSLCGHRVVVLTLTSGELAGNAADREAEEVEAMRRLGAETAFGRLPDGSVSVRAAITIIDEAIRQYDPAIVLVHSSNDTHQDHVAAFEAAIVSCRSIPTLLTYESPSSLGFEPTISIDVSNTWECKAYALAAYVSQMSNGKLFAWVDAVARFRAWPRHVGAVCEGLYLRHSAALPGLQGMTTPARAGHLMKPMPPRAHAR